jgi:hypothetical protein
MYNFKQILYYKIYQKSRIIRLQWNEFLNYKYLKIRTNRISYRFLVYIAV